MFTVNKTKLQKRYFIRIPDEINVILCDEKNILYFSGPMGSKSFYSKVRVIPIPRSNSLFISDILVEDFSSYITQKKKKMLRGLTLAKLKQIITEITSKLHKKLNLVGVGYRAFNHDSVSNQIYFKLGLSHLVYFYVPRGLSVSINKFTKLCIHGGNSIDMLSSTVSNIRRCKLPEPYKGKGILHDQEKISLKKGKKI